MDPNVKPADEYVYTDFYTSVHPNYPPHGPTAYSDTGEYDDAGPANVYRIPLGPNVYTVTRHSDGHVTADHFHADDDTAYPANVVYVSPNYGVACTKCHDGIRWTAPVKREPVD